jgi:predicted small lipoprotein YifL
MKKLIIALAVVLTIFMFAACASQLQDDCSYYSGDPIGIQAEASNTVWFGLFGGLGYPRADKVATDNGITSISNVEHYRQVGTFGLWIVYTTVVTGTGGGASESAE